MGGNAAFLEVGACGRSRARWDPASVRNGPKSITPPPHPPPSIPTRKGTDCGESSKKERFDPKAALTGGLCLTGAAVVALNRRILRGKKGKKRKKQNKQKKGRWVFGSKGSSRRAKLQEIAPKPRQRGRPTRKGRESPAAKQPQKRVGKGAVIIGICAAFHPKPRPGGEGSESSPNSAAFPHFISKWKMGGAPKWLKMPQKWLKVPQNERPAWPALCPAAAGFSRTEQLFGQSSAWH